MNKMLTIPLIFALILGFFCGCSKEEKDPLPSPSASTDTVTADADELEGTVMLKGSSSMEKVISVLSDAFMEKHRNVTVSYEATGSDAGVTSVTEKDVEIGLVSRRLTDSETGLTEKVFALDGLVIIVNVHNPVSDITKEQLVSIAKGETTSWEELGGNSGPISFIGRQTGSGTRDCFESLIEVEDECVYAQELPSTGAVKAAVADDENAVAYISLTGTDTSVKALSIGGIPCTEENVFDGSYPLQRGFAFVTNDGGELSTQAQAFMDFALSEEASELIALAGAVRAKHLR